MIPKFRAWDKEDKIMKEVFNLDFHRYTAVVGFRLSEPKSFLGDRPLIIMQSTGLKDKNGVEIYEGDIVVFNDESDDKYIMCTFLRCFGIRFSDVGFVEFSNMFDGSVSTEDVFTVIGNIYEHPHLLEE